MSQSIEKLALDLQSQVKTLAEEKSTYTERMRQMEEKMEAYRNRCDQMEATMKEYNDRMASLVKAMEEKETEVQPVAEAAPTEEVPAAVPEVPADVNTPTPEPDTKANVLGGVNEQVLVEKMPEPKKAEAPIVVVKAPSESEDEEDEDEEESAPMSKKGKKAKKADEAPAPTAVAEEPKVEAKAEDVAPAPAAPAPVPAISPELLAKIAEVDALKAALAAEVEARKEALASVTKVKGEFESLAERIAKVEKDDMKAEKVIAKKVAEMAVEPVAAAVATEAEKTPEQVVAEFNKLAQTDSKAARKFYLANEEVIRTYSFGKTAKKA